MLRKKRIPTIFLFYFLVAYTLVQFSWWTYLLIKLNKSYIQLQVKIGDVPLEWEPIFNKKIMMIMGEGFVFFLIMLWGIYQIQRSFKRELDLAQQQKNFLLSITHELKTPLASVRLSLETIQKHQLEEKTKNRILEQGINETDRLNMLIEKILFSTRLEDHGIHLNLRETNMSELLHAAIEIPMQTLGVKHKNNIQVEADVFCKIDDWAFKSILINLYENALKYSPEGSIVSVILRKNPEGCDLIVEDEGDGIADDLKTKIFKKFYRVENEETRRVKGTGLGLFIVKSLVNLHNAKIEVEDNDPKGSRFIIKFKK